MNGIAINHSAKKQSFTIRIIVCVLCLGLITCQADSNDTKDENFEKNDDWIIFQILQREESKDASITIYKKNNRVVHISIRKAIIPKFPSQLSRLDSLKSLFLSGNHIQDISDLKDLPALIELQLAGNQIKVFPPLNELNKLKFLSLDDNQIIGELDCDSLPESLESLIIPNNQISRVLNISRLENLKILSIYGNRLFEFPQEICELQEL